MKKLVEAPERVSPDSKKFPTILGPSKNEKVVKHLKYGIESFMLQVCVVGAGPSGIHMALRLKNIGYSDVTVLEKTGRVGGKCANMKYRGVEYTLGATWLEADYFENVVPLARKYANATLIDIPDVHMWEEDSAKGRLIPFPVYMYEGLSKFNSEACPLPPRLPKIQECALFFADVVLKYIK